MKNITTPRIKVLEKCNHKCAYCGESITLNEMQVDHIVSRKSYDISIKNNLMPSFLHHLDEYDINHFDNLIASCKSCNIHKGSLSLEQFRDKIQNRIDRLNTNIRGHSGGSDYRLAKRYGLVVEVIKPVVFFFERI